MLCVLMIPTMTMISHSTLPVLFAFSRPGTEEEELRQFVVH